MTDINSSHNSDCTSSAKHSNAGEASDLAAEFALVQQGLDLANLLQSRSEPMPYIPRTGRWWIAHWASFWGETEENMKKKIRKMDYEPIKFGDTLMIDAGAFWQCLERS